MNSFNPLTRLIGAAAFALFLAQPLSNAGEPSTLPFLKIGSTYALTHSTPGLPVFVKILESSGGAWFRVEYIHDSRNQTLNKQIGIIPPDESPDQAAHPEFEKATMWLNFSSVAGVTGHSKPEPK